MKYGLGGVTIEANYDDDNETLLKLIDGILGNTPKEKCGRASEARYKYRYISISSFSFFFAKMSAFSCPVEQDGECADGLGECTMASSCREPQKLQKNSRGECQSSDRNIMNPGVEIGSVFWLIFFEFISATSVLSYKNGLTVIYFCSQIKLILTRKIHEN